MLQFTTIRRFVYNRTIVSEDVAYVVIRWKGEWGTER